MNTRISMLVVGVAGMAAGLLLGLPWVSAQQRGASPPLGAGPMASDPRFAAVPSEKGGQDVFGAYDVVADWPRDIATIPGHEGWTFGAGQSVFAESANRVFVLQRG